MQCKKCRADIPDSSKFCMECGTPQETQEQKKKAGTRHRGNGAGSAYRRGKTWTAVYISGWYTLDNHRVPKRETKGGFPSKTAALEYIPTMKKKAELKAQAAEIALNAPDTIKALYETFDNGAMKKLSESKQGAYRIAYKRLESIQNCKINDLTIDQLQTLLDREVQTYYPAKDMQNLLSKLFKLAMAHKYTEVNLSRFLVLPELVEAEQKPFVKAEIEALWKDYEAGNTFTGYILLMCYSGMMPGELFDARKDNIDWNRQEMNGCGKKTKKRKATPIVIADYMIPVLHNLCNFSKSEKLLCMNKDNFYKRFHETLNRIGIEDRAPYSCRHTAATELVLDGASMPVVKNIMRHAKLSSTQRYIHVDTSPMLTALNALEPKEN